MIEQDPMIKFSKEKKIENNGLNVFTFVLQHTRSIRREFISSFGCVTGTKAVVLREAYKRVTGDASALDNHTEHKVDEHLREILDYEDPDLQWIYE